MGTWLKKILSPPATVVRSNLPVRVQQKLPGIIRAAGNLELTKGLPRATIVYAIGSAAMFAFALYLIVAVSWVDGVLTMLPAAVLFGFAAHFLKHGQNT
jgi:hypothetical protein